MTNSACCVFCILFCWSICKADWVCLRLLLHTVDGRNPAYTVYLIVCHALYIPGGCLGFLPSTVSISVFGCFLSFYQRFQVKWVKTTARTPGSLGVFPPEPWKIVESPAASSNQLRVALESFLGKSSLASATPKKKPTLRCLVFVRMFF